MRTRYHLRNKGPVGIIAWFYEDSKDPKKTVEYNYAGTRFPSIGEGHTTEGSSKLELTRRYANGEVYEGTVVDGKRHGTGKHTYCMQEPAEYTGAFKDDQHEGYGVLITKAFTNEGTFRANKQEGIGEIREPDGTVRCSGRFKNGFFVGALT